MIEADIAAFELRERFDAVICVFDTLNHLTGFEQWRALFALAAAHLHEGGLFAFDVNTVGQLRRLGAGPPWERELPGATITQEVEWLGDGRAIWHVRIGEHGDGGRPRSHHERIGELGVELARVERALDPGFVALERCDEDGAPPTDDSTRAFYAYARRAG